MLSFLLAALLLRSAPDAPPFLREPDIHGDKVVFTCEGDLWLGDLTTGGAARLTRSEGREYDARFSPDGERIAYTAEYAGYRQVYVMPAAGGAARQVTRQAEQAQMAEWAPDGESLVYRAPGYPAWYAMYSTPIEGGFPQRLPLEYASHLSFAPDGKRFAFTRIPRAGSAWFGYHGGQINAIWTGDLEAKTFRKVHEGAGTDEYPVWTGDRICFIEDDMGDFSVYSMQPDGKGLKRLAGPYPFEVREMGTDGRQLIYEKGPGLERIDLRSGKVEPVTLRLVSDMMHTMPYLTPATKNVEFAHLGPTGKRVLVETRGQVISLPAEKDKGAVRLALAKGGVRYRLPTFSPDGKKMAYLSDETGEQQLYVSDADGLNPKQLTTDTARQLKKIRWSPDGKWIGLTDSLTRLRLIPADGGAEIEVDKATGWEGPEFDFSPDSKWVVYSAIDRFTYYQSVALFEIATREKHVLGGGMTHDTLPAFSTDGKWIVFVSRRHISPTGDEIQNQLDTTKTTRPYLLALRADQKSPFAVENEEEGAPKKEDEKKEDFRIDLDGLWDRLIQVPVAPEAYEQAAVVGDRVILRHGGSILYYDLKDKSSGTYAATASWFQPSQDGKKLLLYNGATLQVVDAAAKAISSSDGRVDFGNYQLRIDPVEEWRGMYWDAWRIIRDYFYVKNMNGADWQAVGEKYAQFLPSVRSRDELNELIRWMLSELSVSHAWTYGGDTRTSPPSMAQSYLGVNVEPHPSGYYRITKIFLGDGYDMGARSPLAEPGLNVKVGDYLIEVEGVPAKAGEDLQAALAGRAGQVIEVKTNSEPTAEGARSVYVKPVGSESQMRYLDWVEGRRRYVAEHSDGRVGYIHIPDMGSNGFARFLAQYFPQRNREALVVDVRFNGGGYVSNNIITILKQKVVSYFNSRNNVQPWSRQGDFFPGPMVCMINEFSGSNGEEFPHHFRALGLGPLVGRRTWGGEVGSDPGWPLADGGRVAVPNYGAWTPEDGWIIESVGVKPDYDIENDPNAYVRGDDPQLDKAIELLLAEMKRHPVVRPTQPADPVRVRKR